MNFYGQKKFPYLSVFHIFFSHFLFNNNYVLNYLTIRQRVVYELIVNESAASVDYLFRDNEAELSNCFSINQIDKILFENNI